MHKLTAAYMLFFVFCTILSGVMEGEGGMVSTQLNGAVSATANTLTVDNTTGFLPRGDLVFGDEEVSYTGTTAVSFTGVSRGINDTTAVAHADDSMVYSPEVGVLHRGLGFTISAVGGDEGDLSVVTMTWNFLTKALPNLVTWDYPFFEGEMVVVRYFLMAAGVGLVIYYGFSAISTAFGILRR